MFGGRLAAAVLYFQLAHVAPLISNMSYDPEENDYEDFDPGEHLGAIVGMLNALSAWREMLNKSVEESDGDPDHVLASVYGEVAYSNAAVSALAPLFEAVFCFQLPELRRFFQGPSDGIQHHRWKLAPDEFWNPRVQSDKGKLKKKEDVAVDNIQHGTIQLITALGLIDQFPQTFADVTEALFYYRNRALHNGYEWRLAERKKFELHIESKDWRGRFSWATINDIPWIIYMNDSFVEECFEMLKATMKTFDDIIAAKSKRGINSPVQAMFQNLYLRHTLSRPQKPV